MGHIKAPIPENEKERQEVLNSYKVLDTLPEQSFDDLTELAAHLCDTPISLVSLIDANRQWFKSQRGLDLTETPREQAFCAHAILSPNEPMIVEDARSDERFYNNPLVVNSPHVLAYAGVPLADTNGMALGTLCVIDNQPRKFTKTQIDNLARLARQVIQLLEARKINLELTKSNYELKKLKNINDQCQKITKIGAWELNIQTGKTIWTEEVYNIHGIDKNYNHNLNNGINFYDPEDRPILTAAIDNTIKTGEEFSLRLRLITAKNERKWVHTTGRKTLNIDNEPILIGAFQDITDQIEIQRKLDNELMRNQCILDGTNVGTWEWNVQSGETKFNERWAEIIGYSLSELEPINIETWLKLVHPDDLEESGKKLESCFNRKNEFYEVEARMRHKNGDWVWVFDRGKVFSWTEDGKPLMMYGTHQDITEKKNKEEDLKYQKELFNAIFQLLPIGVALNDLNTGRFLDVNSKLLESIGYTKEEFLDLSYWDVTPKKYEPEEMKALNEIRQAGYYSSFEKEYIKKSGSLYPVKLNGLLMTDLNGREILLSVIEDITKQKIDQRALQKAKEAAEEATYAKGQFLANMSHEIRTPLTSIIGFAESAKDADISQAERIEALKIIHTNGEHLIKIVDDILDLSKLDAGALKVEILPCSPVSVVNNVRELLIPKFIEKGLSLKVNYREGLPATFGTDPSRLKQILVNLVSNALKFTAQGEVTIDVWHESNSSLYFSVSDTGTGISKQQIPKLFKPFSQGGPQTTGGLSGTGLGLSISKQLIKMLGGEIELKSEPGVGSTFSFYIQDAQLKCSDEALPPVAKNIRTSEGTNDIERELRGNVLIADDSAEIRQLIKFMLRKTDLNLTMVKNGREALEAAQKSEFDVILLDIQMPVMYGDMAAREIRKSNISVPIVAFTANAMKHDIRRYIKSGCTNFLPKPFAKAALIECLHECIQNKMMDSRSIDNFIVSTLYEEEPDSLEHILGFVGNLEKQIAALERAIEKENFIELNEISHNLCGSAGLFGYSELSDLCKALENFANQKEITEAPSYLARVKSVYSAILKGIDVMSDVSKDS